MRAVAEMHDARSVAHQASEHAATTGRFDDLKDAKRECGDMFVQLAFGQKVEGTDVIKLSMVTVMFPDTVGPNKEVLEAIARSNPSTLGLASNIRSFNEDGSLIGAVGHSAKPIDEQELRGMLLGTFQAIESAVVSGSSIMYEADLDKFLLKNTERKAKVGNLVSDSGAIFSNPTHGGAVAYKNASTFGEDIFRMEMVYTTQDGKVTTPAPPHKDYEMTVFDDAIAQDAWDKAYIRTLLDAIKKLSEGDMTSMFAIQVNNTATVASCAGNVQYNAVYNSVAISQGPNSSTSYNPYNTQQPSGSSSGTASGSGSGGDYASFENKVQCSKCGAMNERSVPMCTCAIKSQARSGHAAPSRHSH